MTNNSSGQTIIRCDSWYWITDNNGVTFKQCGYEYNCPYGYSATPVICGLYDSSSTTKTGDDEK